MAYALGLSLRMHGVRARLVLMTDEPEPRLARVWDQLVPPDPDATGYHSKLAALRATGADRVLYVDADCLAMANPDPIFDLMAGASFGVQGYERSDFGRWWGDYGAVMRRLGLASVPYFTGGMLYLERSKCTEQILTRARHHHDRYAEYGLETHAGKPSDEACLSLALAEVGGYRLVPITSQCIASNLTPGAKMRLDVMRGECTITKWYEGRYQVLRPRLYHSAQAKRDWPYWREVGRIIRLHERGVPEETVLSRLGGSFWRRALIPYRRWRKLD
jgi:hypothetical protein